MTTTNDDLRDAIAEVIYRGTDLNGLNTQWIAKDILALPEMQARERVIEAARWYKRIPLDRNLDALFDAVAELDAPREETTP